MVLESDNHLLPAKVAKKSKKWRLIVGLVFIILIWIFWFWATRQLTPIAINQLAQITNTKIKAEAVTIRPNGSVTITGLHIKPNTNTNYDNTILTAKEVYVRFGIFSLLRFNPKIRKISLHNFNFDFQQDKTTGRWNIDNVNLPSSEKSGGLFEIRLKNGEFQYTTVNHGVVKPAMSIPVSGYFKPSQSKGYDFDLTTAKTDSQLANRIEGNFQPGHFNISGGISSDNFPALRHKWSMQKISAQCDYEKNGQYKLDLLINNFNFQGKSSGQIPAGKNSETAGEVSIINKLLQAIEQYHLSGTTDIQLHAKGNFNQPKDMKLNGSVFCKDVSVLYSVFPYKVDNLQGQIAFTEKNLKAENLTGTHGDVKLSINSSFSNFGPNVKGKVVISSVHMPLDNDLYKALWPSQKLLWNEFSPKGFVKFKYTFSIEPNAEKTFALNVGLLNVDSTYKNFPYPLSNLTGNLLFDVDSIAVTNLKSKQADATININGNVIDTDTKNPRFDLVVDVNKIPLNETLANALPDRERNLYHQFSPEGFGTGQILVNNMFTDPNKAYFKADLNFKDTILRPPMIKGDITDIKANGIFEPDRITFRKFDGIYAGQPVSMTGQFVPTQDGNDLTYKMELSSQKVTINEQMLSLIPERFKKHIDKINPSGTFGYLAVLSKPLPKADTDYDVTLNCKDVNIQPDITDIQLEHITGKITINKNAFTFTNLRTNPVDTAAPLINVNGQALLSTNDANQTKIETANISVDANNFPVETKHLDKLSGTVIYDKQNNRWISNDVYGKFYDGKMAGKLEIKKESQKDNPLVMLQIGFDKADLQKFLADTNTPAADCSGLSCYSTGQMNGQINVTGSVGDLSSFYGSCRVEINNMQIGRLSPIAKVLTLLKLTKPSDYLFERMFFDTYLKDRKFYFETFDLSGNALNFGGTGTMDIQSRELNLTFAARGSRISDVSGNLIGSLAGAISPGILQVYVTGSILSPKVQAKPFPVLGGALEILQTKEK